jgi:hypothetical protein
MIENPCGSCKTIVTVSGFNWLVDINSAHGDNAQMLIGLPELP